MARQLWPRVRQGVDDWLAVGFEEPVGIVTLREALTETGVAVLVVLEGGSEEDDPPDID